MIITVTRASANGPTRFRSVVSAGVNGDGGWSGDDDSCDVPFAVAVGSGLSEARLRAMQGEHGHFGTNAKAKAPAEADPLVHVNLSLRVLIKPGVKPVRLASRRSRCILGCR